MLRSLGHALPKSVYLMGRSVSKEPGEVRVSCRLAELARHYQGGGLTEIRDLDYNGVCVWTGEVRSENRGLRPRIQLGIVRENELEGAVQAGLRDRWGFPTESSVCSAGQ